MDDNKISITIHPLKLNDLELTFSRLSQREKLVFQYLENNFVTISHRGIFKSPGNLKGSIIDKKGGLVYQFEAKHNSSQNYIKIELYPQGSNQEDQRRVHSKLIDYLAHQ